jgi:hypothetical protein
MLAKGEIKYRITSTAGLSSVTFVVTLHEKPPAVRSLRLGQTTEL